MEILATFLNFIISFVNAIKALVSEIRSVNDAN